MRFILVAGGSGGHIYPAIELARYLKEKGHNVLLVGKRNSMEERIYKESEFEYVCLNVSKKKLKSLVSNYQEINQIYKKYSPDKLILFGNYISFSFAIIGYKKRIPIYLHEQNVIYGRANKFVGIFAKRVYLSLPINKDIYHKKSMLVGNPKGDTSKLNYAYLPRDKKNVFIVMGSLGSETVNTHLMELIKIADSNINYHIVTGRKHYIDFTKQVEGKKNIYIYPYLNDLISYTSRCDLFVSRAGATTISEIINYKIPSILIPSPYVRDNHQYKNAKYLLDHSACRLINEKDVTPMILNEKIKEIVFDEKAKIKLKDNLSILNIDGSKQKIYEDIING